MKKNDKIKKVKKVKKKQIIVDKEGKINTISTAVLMAENNSEILIKSGLYFEKIIINKSITLMPKEDIGEVIIITNSGSSVLINVPDDGKVIIKNIKFGLTLSDKYIKDENQNQDHLINDLLKDKVKEKKKKFDNDDDPLNNILNNIKINNNWDCIINLKNGFLSMLNCILTLKTLQNTTENIIPICISYNNSKLKIKKCNIYGNETNPSVGIIVNEGSLILENTSIQKTSKRAIFIYNDEKKSNKVLIDHNKIHENLSDSIEILGKNPNIIIRKNIIEKNSGIGIILGVSTNAIVEDCILRSNFYGIKLISSQSTIVNNKIKGNKFDGIYSTVFRNFINNSIIKNNSIERNKKNGILIDGLNNNSMVSSNINISQNLECGILVTNLAYPNILRNKIFLNEKQGILLVENSQSLIEKNEVYKNIKANIAWGGLLCQNTVIKNNKIYNSTAEGIFIMLGAKCIVYNNIIDSNYDGIIIFESSPDIKFNKIFNNKNQGIMLINGSKPFLNFNKIINNEGIGLFIKDKSEGYIFNNLLENNEINLSIENYKMDTESLIRNNNINSNIFLAQKPNCNIF